VARPLALAATVAAALLAVSGAGGAATQQTAKRGGTVVFGPVREPACLSPSCGGLGPGGGPAVGWIDEIVLPPAFVVGPDSSLRPRLVSRVSYTTTEPFTLTYHIRPEARWSDGIAVTARDFIFTDKVIRRYATDSSEPQLQVRSVSAVDAKTVRVVLGSRFAGWRALFWSVLPQHVLAGEDLAKTWVDGIDNPRTAKPIGSGPFLVQSWERGKQLTLVRNPEFWGPHTSYLDRIVIRFCREVCNAPRSDEVLDSLREGRVDFAFSRVTADAPELRRISGLRVLAAATNGWEHFDINRGAHPALQSKLVRRALIYGIDRVAIVRRLFAEIDPRYPLSNSAIFLNSSRYYTANWSAYRYRPTLARRLLEQSGCRRGSDGIEVCAGRRLSLRFLTTPGQAVRALTLQLVQAQLRRIGAEVVPVYGPGPQNDADVNLFTWFYAADLTGLKNIFGCGGSGNFTGYCQRLVTSDLDEADRILDADQRARVLSRADRRMAKDVPVIPLYQVPLVYAFRSSLRGIQPAPFDPFWNAEDWWLER
jgi:peptide/nickel transport system substrate-binding protein